MKSKPIPFLTLTLGQQGGIGNPPVIVKLEKWYAISDSREIQPPEELDLEYQSLLKPYRYAPMKYYHPQTWTWKKWHSAPRITWAELLEKCQ